MKSLEELQKANLFEVLEPSGDYEHIVVLTHGIAQGKETLLLQLLAKQLLENNFAVVLFNFSYYGVRQEVNNTDEIEDLNAVLQHIFEKYPSKKVHLCGKSYGAVVASKLLEKFPEKIQTIAAFGFIKNFKGFETYLSKEHKLFVVQGELDDFHSPSDAATILKAAQTDFDLFEVKGAGHGLNDSNKEFVGQEAIAWYVNNLVKLVQR